MPKKINIIVRLQNWMDSVPGQTFLNYAYSWGAAIVILGALFKLTHIQGGNIMLFIGMGTEVIVFFLAAFDRPFDRNEVGKELPEDIETDEQMSVRLGLNDNDDLDNEETETDANNTPGLTVIPVIGSGTAHTCIRTPQSEEELEAAESQATVIAAAAAEATEGSMPCPDTEQLAASSSAAPAHQPAAPIVQTITIPVQPETTTAESTPSDMPAATPTDSIAAAAIAATAPKGGQPFEQEAQRLAQIIRVANDELLQRAQAVLSPEMEAATQTYIEKLRTLADTFAKVDEQSARLAKDSEEMENLNRTLTGINKVYELHLKSISLQVGTIDQINDQTHKLANQIEELNAVYGRMIEALTVNMRGNKE
ncbi:MAG: gliding motility protein GldL [Bacteroidales bacterium]|nr:gliding motility protein GldL [Bacteroidales bacterium]